MKKSIVTLIVSVLLSNSLHAVVVKKEIPAYDQRVFVYYQDGVEVAREIIDAEGNLRVTGKIPAEYYNKQDGGEPARDARTPEERLRENIAAMKSEDASSQPAAFGEELWIKVNPDERLSGGLNAVEFARFRAKKVMEYGKLNIYPDDYSTLAPPHNLIYRSIAFETVWTHEAEYFICNPYLLIVLSKAESTGAFEERCGLTRVRYRNGVIEENYRGSQASEFFALAETGTPELSKLIKIWTVNAQDAGFLYVTVDREKCANIDFGWNGDQGNIANCVYSSQTSYNGDLLNDISPNDDKAVIKLKDTYKYTCIYIKLWRNKPSSREAKEDFAYVIRVEDW